MKQELHFDLGPPEIAGADIALSLLYCAKAALDNPAGSADGNHSALKKIQIKLDKFLLEMTLALLVGFKSCLGESNTASMRTCGHGQRSKERSLEILPQKAKPGGFFRLKKLCYNVFKTANTGGGSDIEKYQSRKNYRKRAAANGRRQQFVARLGRRH
jgi:hypothetical protein